MTGDDYSKNKLENNIKELQKANDEIYSAFISLLIEVEDESEKCLSESEFYELRQICKDFYSPCITLDEIIAKLKERYL